MVPPQLLQFIWRVCVSVEVEIPHMNGLQRQQGHDRWVLISLWSVKIGTGIVFA